MLRSTVGGLLAGLIAVAPAHAQPAPPSDAKSPLNKRVTHDYGYDRVELGEVLEDLSHRCSVKIAIDRDAFQRAGLTPAEKVRVDLPKLPGVPLEFALEMAVRQAGGTVRAEADRIMIAPSKPREYETFLPPPGQAMREKLLKRAAIERPILNAPLRDIVDFLSDRYEVYIFIDAWAFEKAGRKEVLDTPCSSPASDTKLSECVAYFAAQVHGKVLFRDEVILILPESKK
jgi:hypothetical protein